MSANPANGDHNEDSVPTERVVVRTFASHSAAELAAASLEAHGIKCWITADDAGGMLPHLATAGGVKLFVLSPDSAAAVALLTAQPFSSEWPPAGDGQANTNSDSPVDPRKKGALAFLLVGIVLGILLCLAYQSTDTRGDHKYSHDRNGDGRVDELRIYRNGYIKQFLKDRNFDGQWDEWADYDDQGRMTIFRQDNNFDCKADEFGTHSNGELLSQEWDTDFNGTNDLTYTFKYGLIQRAEWKPNGSLFVTRREDYTNGTLSEASLDLDGDGKFDEVVRYDAFHNPVTTNIFKLLSTGAP